MTQVKPNIHSIGVVEWSLRHFHGHELSIHRGTSYNSYLIVDEKIALIDFVRSSRTEEFLKNIEAIVPFEKIDYLIMNHSEPDHSGALPAILARAPQAKVVVSKNGQISLGRHYPGNWNVQVVKTGDTISLGKRSLRFFEAQMVHWPDSMFSYCPEDRILFSNDAFGEHFAASSIFADEADMCEVWQEAVKYFANILTPYSQQIQKKIKEFLSLNWSVEMICPAHGLVWRKDVTAMVNKYLEWASGKVENSAVILYDTIWGGTEKMALAIGQGLEAEGVPFKLFNAGIADLSDVVAEIFKAKGTIVGTPTLNNGAMPTLMPFLEMIRNLRFQNKMGAAFGTYGWSGEGVKRIEEFMQHGGFKIAQMGIRAQFSPQAADLDHCMTFGRGFAKLMLAS